ncbi:MAG: helix-turn-helix transcriptional regulator [Ruminococcus sp.]|nr:helix-turn-helix transcriptional regulator [Ruminococcus sp.]MCM1479919.1 helix-turn-helix transcriptional regulator [Muribaculaceae bacterium]
MTVLKEKSTDEMWNEIKSADDYESFAADNAEEFTAKDISDCLNELLTEKGIDLKDAVKKSGIERTYAYHIFSGKKVPSRDKLIAIAFGMGLDLEETQRLLKRTRNRPLYPKDERDAIIIYSLLNGLQTDITNERLYERGFDLI